MDSPLTKTQYPSGASYPRRCGVWSLRCVNPVWRLDFAMCQPRILAESALVNAWHDGAAWSLNSVVTFRGVTSDASVVCQEIQIWNGFFFPPASVLWHGTKEYRPRMGDVFKCKSLQRPVSTAFVSVTNGTNGGASFLSSTTQYTTDYQRRWH